MKTSKPADQRLAYIAAIASGLRLSWPIVSAFLIFNSTLGALVGLIEGWGVWKGIYFAFVTGLTIGYGDLVPTQAVTRIMAIVLGFSGIFLTALLAAIAVRALQVISKENAD